LSTKINNHRFIPYIQMHEFEALVFVDLSKLSIAFPDDNVAQVIASLKKSTANLEPELINHGEASAPSKRLIRELPAYEQKRSVAGYLVTEEIGIIALKAACPHFCSWITKLEQLSS
jgi:hypothetical protein